MGKVIRIFLFGEAEKGDMRTPIEIKTLSQLSGTLGSPPAASQGIGYATEAILSKHELIYFRVAEEGFSKSDYSAGSDFLNDQGKILNLSAIAIPGVGNSEIIDQIAPICRRLKALLLLKEGDLYDYLTGLKY